MQRLALLLTLAMGVALAADKYDGPRPPKPDLVYLVHADNLIPTEALEAKEEWGVYTVPGAASPARTPLAEPIFLIESDKVLPERLELYRWDVKGGRRELATVEGQEEGRRSRAAPVGQQAGRETLPGGSFRAAGQRAIFALAERLQQGFLLRGVLSGGILDSHASARIESLASLGFLV